jgi:hypothetical protein
MFLPLVAAYRNRYHPTIKIVLDLSSPSAFPTPLEAIG